jgi:predicted MFS family arabinose efflux permease
VDPVKECEAGHVVSAYAVVVVALALERRGPVR